ncbi:MAG: polymer-forming cytoskeletal protein [Bacteroidota bacterium]
MAKNIELESPVINIIGNGTTIKGDINASGDMRIDGTLIGSISSLGKVVIGVTGLVEGEIVCQNADFSGSIKAKVNVNELLAMKSSASLIGDICTGKLSIEPGAKFSGSCKMSGDASKQVPTGKTIDEKTEQFT